MDPALRELVREQELGTISQGADAYQAAQRMSELGLGCLIVLNPESQAVGIVTDRDLTLRVVARSADPAELQMREIMSAPLISMDADQPLEAAISLMQSHGIRRVPILREGLPIGVVALDDVLQLLAREMDDLGKEAQIKMRQAKSKPLLDRVARDIDRKLLDAHTRLQETTWVAREALLVQIEDLRDRVRRTMSTPESE